MPRSRGRKRSRRVSRSIPKPPTKGMTPEHLVGMTWKTVWEVEVAAPEGIGIVADLLTEQVKKFRAKFGRVPTQEDPVMFDPDADTPQFMKVEKLRSEMIEAMKKAGIPGHLIYAYEKTGLILAQRNMHLHSREQIAAWNKAMAEYEQLTPTE